MVRHGQLDESVISNNTVRREEEESRDDKSVKSIPQKTPAPPADFEKENNEQTPPRNRAAMDLRKKPTPGPLKRGPGQAQIPTRPGVQPATAKKEPEQKESAITSPDDSKPVDGDAKLDATEQSRPSKVLRSNPFARKAANPEEKKETVQTPPQQEEPVEEDVKTPQKEISTQPEPQMEEPEDTPKTDEPSKKTPPGPVFKPGPPKINPPRVQPGARPPGGRPPGPGAPKRPAPPA